MSYPSGTFTVRMLTYGQGLNKLRIRNRLYSDVQCGYVERLAGGLYQVVGTRVPPRRDYHMLPAGVYTILRASEQWGCTYNAAARRLGKLSTQGLASRLEKGIYVAH